MSGKELSLYDGFLAVFKAFLFKTTGSDFTLVAGYTLLKIGSKHFKLQSCALQFGAFSVTFEGDEENHISAKYVKKNSKEWRKN